MVSELLGAFKMVLSQPFLVDHYIIDEQIIGLGYSLQSFTYLHIYIRSCIIFPDFLGNVMHTCMYVCRFVCM